MIRLATVLATVLLLGPIAILLYIVTAFVAEAQ